MLHILLNRKVQGLFHGWHMEVKFCLASCPAKASVLILRQDFPKRLRHGTLRKSARESLAARHAPQGKAAIADARAGEMP